MVPVPIPRIVFPYDKVKTKTGRVGVVKAVSHNDTAHIVWEEEGIEFALRFCHLQVVEHNSLLPDWYCRKEEKSHGRND